jgi:hypothetical protein
MHRSPRPVSDRRAARSVAAALALTAGLAIAPPAARAQPSSTPSKGAVDEASSRFRRGVELYKEGDYRAALIEFRRAYELAPNFNVLYNMGQVHFQLQDYVGALSALERYLSDGGSQVPAARRAEVTKDIEKLKARVAKVEIVANVEGAEITIDDVPSGKTPLAKPVLVSAGRRKITVSKNGWLPATKLVDVAGADSLRVSLELTENQAAGPVPVPVPSPTPGPATSPQPAAPSSSAPGSTPRPPAPKDEPSLTPLIVGWSVTAGLTAGAVVCGALALGASDDLATQRDQAGASRAELDDAESKTTTLALVTDLLAAGAIVAGGVSVYLTASRPSSAESAAATTVRLGVAGTGVRLDGTF